MATTVFNPDANPESTSVDGWIARDTDGTWSAIRTGAGEVVDDSTTVTDMVRMSYAQPSSQYSFLSRTPFLFDTSSIGSGQKVSSATFQVYITAKDNTIGNLSFVLVASTPASNTALVTADYLQTGSVALSNAVAVNNITTSAYNTWTLNETGLAAINMLGITKLALVFENDRSNTEPSPPAGSGAITTKISGHFAGAASEPKLTVVYTPAIPGGYAAFI